MYWSVFVFASIFLCLCLLFVAVFIIYHFFLQMTQGNIVFFACLQMLDWPPLFLNHNIDAQHCKCAQLLLHCNMQKKKKIEAAGFFLMLTTLSKAILRCARIEASLQASDAECKKIEASGFFLMLMTLSKPHYTPMLQKNRSLI